MQYIIIIIIIIIFFNRKNIKYFLSSNQPLLLLPQILILKIRTLETKSLSKGGVLLVRDEK
jgi:hypothetical protein